MRIHSTQILSAPVPTRVMTYCVHIMCVSDIITEWGSNVNIWPTRVMTYCVHIMCVSDIITERGSNVNIWL